MNNFFFESSSDINRNIDIINATEILNINNLIDTLKKQIYIDPIKQILNSISNNLFKSDGHFFKLFRSNILSIINKIKNNLCTKSSEEINNLKSKLEIKEINLSQDFDDNEIYNYIHSKFPISNSQDYDISSKVDLYSNLGFLEIIFDTLTGIINKLTFSLEQNKQTVKDFLNLSKQILKIF